MIPLSILDLSFVTSATPPSRALANSLDLAQLADGMGYRRYWVAEHHSLPSVASSAPEILIGQIAAVTRDIRVGAGGVMLTNHAPLMVAERFKMLEALFPGRIDLGLGRAPGTDQVTAHALRRRMETRQGDDFLERLQELVTWESRDFPEGHPYNNVIAMPSDALLPPIWLLGSSNYSSELAAMVGAGYAFAHHFSDFDGIAAMLSYRQRFQSSGWRAKPYAVLAVAAIVAESDAAADRLATSWDLNWLRRRRGELLPYPSPEEAAAFPYSPQDRERIAAHRQRLFAGSPETVASGLRRIVKATQADELMITTPVFDHEARRRSCELLMQAWRQVAPSPEPASAG